MSERRELDQYTLIAELGTASKAVMGRGLLILAIPVFGLALKLYLVGSQGTVSYLWMAIGMFICLAIWRSSGLGLPLVPVIALQHFVVYAMPINNWNETISGYPQDYYTSAGQEVFLFLISMGVSWQIVIRSLRPVLGYAYPISVFQEKGGEQLKRVGVALIICTTVFTALDFAGVIGVFVGLMPAGTQSILTAAMSASNLAGFFLVSMIIGSGMATQGIKIIFGIALFANFALFLTSLLISTAFGLVGAVGLGFFWASGRVPTKFLIIVTAFVGFLQIGKIDMRTRYGQGGDGESPIPMPTLVTIPSFYADWFNISYKNIVNSEERRVRTNDKNISLADRVNNLQNLLYVINAVQGNRIPILGGGTYTIIPALLVPRILWPEKPRTHEGQIMLNEHFGRQSRDDSVGTYIAWGLLPEAYGNFGPFFGAVILGVVLGGVFAWFESATALCPLLSLEGMCSFGLLIGLATSFEMVASVLVTSQFQSMVTIMAACLPFVRKTKVGLRPDEEEEAVSP